MKAITAPKKRELSGNILSCVRGRLGVKANESDTSKDSQITAMHPEQIVRRYFGWRLGDDTWGSVAIDVIEQAYGVKFERQS